MTIWLADEDQNAAAEPGAYDALFIDTAAGVRDAVMIGVQTCGACGAKSSCSWPATQDTGIEENECPHCGEMATTFEPAHDARIFSYYPRVASNLTLEGIQRAQLARAKRWRSA